MEVRNTTRVDFELKPPVQLPWEIVQLGAIKYAGDHLC